MPVYVPNYKHDVFVSYAHVDNEPFTGAKKGWVTTLINSLAILLGKKLGRVDAFSLWMDDELRENQTVPFQIIEQLEGSAILVLILSPGYLTSLWCHSELKTFLTKMPQNLERVFLIEPYQVERPPELAPLLSHPFWGLDASGKPQTLGLPKPNPEQFEYYQKLDDLARQLANQLKALKTNLIPTKTTPITHTASTIFLAETPADLEDGRQTIKRFLEQQGIRILPAQNYALANRQQSLDQDLSESHLFVQLLSETATNEYPQLQYERASIAHLPILQWRSPTLKLSDVSEPSQRALLETGTVIASSIVSFKTLILKKLKITKKIQNKSSAKKKMIFINATYEDIALAHKIKNILKNSSMGYSLPLEVSAATTSAEIRQYLEHNLLACDAVFIIYAKTSIVWVNEQLRYCRRMQGRREQPFKAIVVYNMSSSQQIPLTVKLPNLYLLESSSSQIDTCLSGFLQSLQT